MVLQISNHNNFFKIKGVLNKDTIHIFHHEFKYVFDKFNSLILSLECLESIDRYGVNALAKLQNESLSKGKNLSIIGSGNSSLYNHFKSETAA